MPGRPLLKKGLDRPFGDEEAENWWQFVCRWSMILLDIYFIFLTSVLSKSKIFQNILVSSSSSWFGMSKPNQKRPLQVPLWALESREPMWGTALDVHRSWGRGNGWCYSPERVDHDDDHLRKENSPGPGWTEAAVWMPKLALMEAVLHHLGRFEVDVQKMDRLSDAAIASNFCNMSSINRRDRMTWSLRCHRCGKKNLAGGPSAKGWLSGRLYWKVLVENVLYSF